MILVYEDEGCIHTYDSPETVVSAVEGLDAEHVLCEVFDDSGRRYVIEWRLSWHRRRLGSALATMTSYSPIEPPNGVEGVVLGE